MLEPGSSPATFQLSAVVQHYGRHENGHYICYRKHPGSPPQTDDEPDDDDANPDAGQERWWRLSDEDVTPVSEDVALGQAGAFMLFYDRVSEQVPAEADGMMLEAASIPLPSDQASDWDHISMPTSTAAPSLAQSVISDTDTDLTSEAETGNAFPLPAAKQPIQPQISAIMKTATDPTELLRGLGMERPSLMSV
jgi:ubiquitin carboxyl-terminal hydrolase 1